MFPFDNRKFRKGFNQIDLAIGVTIMIFIITTSLIYTTQRTASVSESVESYISSERSDLILNSVFGSRGIPADWAGREKDFVIRPALGEYIYRDRIRIANDAATNYTDLNLSVVLYPEGRGSAGSFVAYDGSSLLSTGTPDGVSGQHPDEINLSFTVDVDANETKLVFIYYSNDTNIDFDYDSHQLTDQSDVTATFLSEERFTGVTQTKLDSVANFTVSEFRDRFGMSDGFRFTLGNWSYGEEIPDTQSRFISRKTVLHQNFTGHVESEELRVIVW